MIKNTRPFKRDWKPWTSQLEGKRVLVVTEFSDSIRFQYSRKEKIARWKISELPEFELITYQMINTMCGNSHGFNDFFEAYKKVRDDILKIDFDIVLIGAGAYGCNLSADIKRSGRGAIQLCSYTPLIFGVIGQRYIEQGVLDEFGTKDWIRPIEKKPDYYKEIEGGCYW